MVDAKVIATKRADENHAVLTVHGGRSAPMALPCRECPWRRENAGSFPAEAFRISASTARDMATSTFGCHMRGSNDPATCAGFLLSESSADNLAVRLRFHAGKDLSVEAGGADLYATYRDMAEANGVDADDPTIAECMPQARWRRFRGGDRA